MSVPRIPFELAPAHMAAAPARQRVQPGAHFEYDMLQRRGHHLERAPRRSLRAGSALIELLAATLIMLVLLGTIGMVVQTSSQAYGQGSMQAEVDAQARRMVERIADELIDASRATLSFAPVAPFGSNRVDFRRVEDVVAGAPQLSTLQRIRLAFAPGEVNDGLDNDGNGLIDECRVELVPDQTNFPAQSYGLGGFAREFLEGEDPNGGDDNGNGFADENGLCMSYDNVRGTVTIRLTLERIGSEGAVITSTVETAVRVRNE